MSNATTVQQTVDRYTSEQRDRFFARKEQGQLAKPEPRLLNPELAALARQIGHTDMLLLADMGFPTPGGVPCVDLSLLPGVPTIPQVLEALSVDGFHFDRMIITAEMGEASPQRVDELRQQFPEVSLESLDHVQFKHLGAACRGTVRTGDAVPYANLILVCG